MATLLLEIAVRAALVAVTTACVLWALRIRSAAVRHAAWTTVVVAMLLLPAWSIAGPKLRLAVLPAAAAPLGSVSGPNLEPGNPAPLDSVTERPVPTAERASTAGESAPWMLVLFGVYLLGASALLVRLGIGTVQAQRLRRAVVMQDGRATSARCATPVTVGWFSPVLILPEGWKSWSTARLDAVVTHEREHARRHDPLVQWLALLNRAVFWFHPLAWWLERQLATLAEEVCDAAVIRAGHSPEDYSTYLIDMARALTRQGRRVNVVATAMPGSGLPARMRRIFEELPMRPLPRARVICTLALCTMASVVCAAGILAPRSSAAGPQATPGGPQPGIVSLATQPAVPPAQAPAASQISADRAHQQAATTSEPPDHALKGTNARLASAVDSRSGSTSVVRGEPARVSAAEFSGRWLLVSATYSGAGRGGSGAAGVERNITTKWVSGAPVNCGPDCTIAQDATTLTIRRLVNPEGNWRPDNGEVVLNLDGSDSKVILPSGSHYVVHANWRSNEVVVVFETPWHFTVTQVLSIQDGKLKVVTDMGHGDAPVTFTYVKG